MLSAMRKRIDREDEGFTLIELMVVVLIIAILLAIAIPTFLGARERAQDRAVQSNLRNALTAAKSLYTDTEDYRTALGGTTATEATGDKMKASEPTMCFNENLGSTGTCTAGPIDYSDAKEIGFETQSATVGDTGIILAARSKAGKCFYVRELVPTSGSGSAAAASGNRGVQYAAVDGTCNLAGAGIDFTTAGAPWGNKW